MTKEELIEAIRECDRYIFNKEKELSQKNAEISEIVALRQKMRLIVSNFDLKSKENISNIVTIMSMNNTPCIIDSFCFDMFHVLIGTIYIDAVKYLETSENKILKKEKDIGDSIENIKFDISKKQAKKRELQYKLNRMEALSWKMA